MTTRYYDETDDGMRMTIRYYYDDERATPDMFRNVPLPPPLCKHTHAIVRRS
jgi:hypothetical protein